MEMDTIFWLVAIVAFGVLEGATAALVSVWFMLGAAVAMLVSLFTASLAIQFIVFAVVSAIAFAVLMPILAKRRGQHKAPVTNGSPLTIGKRGVVLRALNPGELGRVRVDGLDWQAKSDAPLPEGSKIQVIEVDGAVLIVAAAEAPV